jgi:Zn-dependent metalloprotease/alpha-tubulin suppressor-like RCC1 family protein
MKTGIVHPPPSPAPLPNPICSQSPHNRRHLTAALICLAFWLASVPASLAQSAAAKVAKPVQTPRWSRVASSNQLHAVKLAEAEGIRVEWHQDLGTPRSIRGTQLDRSAEWSNPGRRLVAATERPEERAFGVLANLSRVYQMREPRQEMRVKRTERDLLGYQHVRMEQVYQGLRVFGGDLIVHFNKEGHAYQVNGEYVADIQAGLTPQIKADEAVRLAQTNLTSMGMSAGKVDEGPERVIFALNHEPELAWQLQLSYQDTQIGPGQWRYWVSARSGEVLLRYDNVQRMDAPTTNGVSATIKGFLMDGEGGAAVSFTGWRENTGYYYLRDTNLAFCIYNSGTNGFPDDGTFAWRSSSDWGRSDGAEISVANNFAIVERYYRDVHGRNSYDNLGSYINVYVHDPATAAAGNDGFYFTGQRRITFGDGDGVLEASGTSLDICGHEFTHGVTEYTANLVNANESGALNEAFSDIFGTCIEFYAQPDGRSSYACVAPGKADWLFGEDSSSITGRYTTDFRNPRRVGNPSAYLGSAWVTGTTDNGGVHWNCGVQEFFFYLLSEGGSGINDGIAYNVTGIGITNAEKVAYRALTVYCTSSTDYNAVRTAWISAATDLNPNWVANVRAAWAAVHLSDFLQVTAPQNQIVLIGSNAAFSVTAKGATPTGYQWWKDGDPIPGANSASLVIPAAQAADVGNYSVVVTSASGVVTSSVARLELSTGPRLVAWGGGANSAQFARIPNNTGGLVSLATGVYWNYGLKKDGSLAAWSWNDTVAAAPPGSPSDVAAVAAGGSFGLALRTNGTVFGWGFDDEGQTSITPSLSNVVAISAASQSSLLVTDDGKVFGYGGDAFGTSSKSGGKVTDFYKLSVPEGLDHVVAVSSAVQQWMALKDDGSVVSWGLITTASTPQLTNAVAISAGSGHNLALKADGTVVAWSSQGQASVPSGLSNVVAISAGYYGNGQNWSMALTTDGTVVAWGDNNYHQTEIPAGLNNVVAISAGGVTAPKGGAGYDCGYALVGSGAPFIQPLPMRRVVLPGRKTFFYAAATGQPPMVCQWYHDGVAMIGSTNALLNLNVSGIADAGDYWLAVSNSLGTATSSVVKLTVPCAPFIENSPVDQTIFPGGKDLLSVSAGGVGPLSYQWYENQTAIPGATNSTLALSNLMTNQTGISVVVSNQYGVAQTTPAATTLVPIAAWGNNAYGQCGVPASMTNVVAVAGGLYHTLALRDDGTVAAWGAGLPNANALYSTDNYGQSIIPRALGNVKAIAAGRYSSLALRNDGTVSKWGYGGTVLNTLNGVSAICAGQYHWLALMSNGTVVVQGGTAPPADLSEVKAMSAGYSYSLALLSNSTVTAWGNNSYGQTSVPAGLSNVVAINAGYRAALALKADGTVTAWGDNSYGQLDVPAGLSNVVAISGSTAFLALKNDGTVVAWGGSGSEDYGQADVPVGLTKVTAISSNGRHSLALVKMPTSAGPEPPVLQPVALNGSSILLNWSAVAGQNYQVQYRSDLAQGDWQLLTSLTATNTTATASDTIIADRQRFYRVVLLP